MSAQAAPSTIDTNIAVYALLQDPKAEVATAALRRSVFLSTQVLNEYANVARRKLGRSWSEIIGDIRAIKKAVPTILALSEQNNADAIDIATRYQLGFYDALMLAAALSGGAEVIYSDDMQHGLTVDGRLQILNPYITDSA